MSNTFWEDKSTEEILSPHINGLQDAVKNIEESLDMDTEALTNETLTLVTDDSGNKRIAQADTGKRNWLNVPAPVIEQFISGVWTVIVANFTIDYAGGAIVYPSGTDKDGEQYRASFTRVKNTSGYNTHLLDYASYKEEIAMMISMGGMM